MRKPFVAGNWKMNLTRAEAVALAGAVAKGEGAYGGVEVGVVPAFVHLDAVGQAIKGSSRAAGGAGMCAWRKMGRLRGRFRRRC